MSTLRDKFKATKVTTIKKSIDAETALLGWSDGKRDYLRLESGQTTKIRIYPKFPQEDKYWQMRSYYWLPFQTNDGQISRRTFADSRHHGGYERDIVDEYIKFIKANFADDEDKMSIFTRQKDGLGLTTTWAAYACEVTDDDQVLTPKIWEFKKTVRDLLRNLACDEDCDGIIEEDPFTDPNTGLIVRVKFNKNPDKKRGENYYEVGLGKTPKQRPLTDEELEAFDKVTPLSELFSKYTLEDFEDTLKALQTLDDEEGLDVFDSEEWLEIVNQVRAQYKSGGKSKAKTEDDDDEDEVKKPAKKSATAAKPAKKQQEPDEDEEDEEDEDDDEASSDDYDQYDEMSRDELKRHIKKNGLDVVVKKSMSDDDIRNAIRKAQATTEEDTEDDEEDEDEEEVKTAPAKSAEAPKSQKERTVEDIKSKLLRK